MYVEDKPGSEWVSIDLISSQIFRFCTMEYIKSSLGFLLIYGLDTQEQSVRDNNYTLSAWKMFVRRNILYVGYIFP